jgi:amidophosphoribosyltransferase
LKGKRVVVVDDSIVRGTTSRKIVKMLRDVGAKEVHLRIASPPNQWPCYYGIDTPTRAELIASTHTVDEINQYITSDSLAYLTLDDMANAVLAARQPDAEVTRNGNGKRNGRLPVVAPTTKHDFCHACWSGEYPIQFHPHAKPRQMRLLDL